MIRIPTKMLYPLPAFQLVHAADAICSCQRPTPSVGQAESHESRRRASCDADDVARFIAGLPGTPGSPFAELETTDAGKNTAASLTSLAQDRGSLISGLQQFQQQELSAAIAPTTPVFYPFGGPDALTPSSASHKAPPM
jgi:hypothetical protein